MKNTDNPISAPSPLNRLLVMRLYQVGLINQLTKNQALNWLYPRAWRYWIAYLLSYLGYGLILSGLVYFFAFNWQYLPPLYKLAALQGALLISLAPLWMRSLNPLTGKLLLLTASLLVGIFLGVFGQIYQTGADSYQLFLAWALLITPWVIVSQFTPLYFIWFVLCNVSLLLFWKQQAHYSLSGEYLILLFLLILNGTFLLVQEYLYRKRQWLSRWMRLLMALTLLLISATSIHLFISHIHPVYSLSFSALAGFMVHGIIFFYYRFIIIDKWIFTLVLVSLAFIIEHGAFKLLLMLNLSHALEWLIMTFFALVIFAASGYLLMKCRENA